MEKWLKLIVERKLKTLDKKNKKLINKSRLQLNNLSEEIIKLNKKAHYKICQLKYQKGLLMSYLKILTMKLHWKTFQCWI